jgi:hypothetical protein
MTVSQPIRRHAAAVWRAARRTPPALRASHDEQILMWELVLAVQPRRRRANRAAGLGAQPGRAPADRQPPAHPRRRQRQQHAMTSIPPPEPLVGDAAAAPRASHRLRLW